MTEAGTSPTDVLARLADRCDEDGLPYAVGGALALGAWGVPRTTSDVDVSVFERFVKTIKHECLQHFVFFGERHLRYVVREFMAHYHRERFHQGLGGRLIEMRPGSTSQEEPRGKVVCRSRLGGMLNFYYRQAA